MTHEINPTQWETETKIYLTAIKPILEAKINTTRPLSHLMISGHEPKKNMRLLQFSNFPNQ